MKSSGNPSAFNSIGVLGAGAWGTALAMNARSAGRQVRVWAFEPEVAQALSSGAPTDFLPDVSPGVLPASTDFGFLADCDAVLVVSPAQHMRRVLTGFAPHARPGLPVALCSKGIERGSLQMMTQVLAECLPDAVPAVLSGPSFAIDVARGLPTAVTLACADAAVADAWMQAVGRPLFRPYRSDDLIGAEAGGAVKNVLAIACGVVEGLGLGRSAHAALIARGFAEMTRFGVALGGRAETLAGLCGLGDLVLTCSSPQSRNMSFGLRVGQGEAPAAILASRNSVTEGAETAPAAVALARKLGVEMPICEAVAALVDGRLSARDAMDTLLSRPFRSEV